MTPPLRLLIVEDNPEDAEMILRELRRAGYAPEWKRVETERDYLAEISGGWDIVTADYSLPFFSGPRALEVLKQSGLDIPLIIVSGTIGEETAVAAMKAGANDYVMKSQLTRLVPAIERELRDAKVRKESRLIQQRYRLLFESAWSAITVIEPPLWNFTAANPAAVSMFGAESEEEFLSQAPWDLSPEFQPDECHSATKALQIIGIVLREGHHSFEWVHRRLGGGDFPAEVLLTRMESGGKSIIQGNIRDITERKSMEGKVLEALRHAEAANRAKSDFLAVMSHELRTPLNGVLGFSELLSFTPIDPEQRDYVETITKSGTHLLDIVNDILDFSSIENGHIHFESGPIVLADILDSCVRTIRIELDAKPLDFHCTTESGVPPLLIGDARRLKQILLNLLGNAVKFTPGGSVELRVSPAELEGAPSVDFAVEDTGPGIPPELVERLFQPFTQGDSTLRRPFQGTGLGLAISKRLAQGMGGALFVRSATGIGSTFTLRLPLHSNPPHIPPMQGSPPLAILVVEDDPLNSELAGKMLARLGYPIEFAFHGEEALAAFGPGKYAAILMDLQMPLMNGLDATRKIRALEASCGGRVPIIALTANVMPGDRELCLAAGMDDFVSKPLKIADLTAKIALFAPRPDDQEPTRD